MECKSFFSLSSYTQLQYAAMLTQSYYETVSCSETHVPDVEQCPYTILLVSSRESSAAESQRAVCLIEM